MEIVSDADSQLAISRFHAHIRGILTKSPHKCVKAERTPMLLRFSVSNFGSLREKQELSLIASKLKGDTKGLIEAPELRNETILPAAVIYGPNASGKSNLIQALA